MSGCPGTYADGHGSAGRMRAEPRPAGYIHNANFYLCVYDANSLWHTHIYTGAPWRIRLPDVRTEQSD
ncbi:hypothetical protein AA0474_0488 [Acetobacter lovaniensis NRIC 0474]|nr:hypothetical protein AA0474_0488 [Acetobacter lovaniensis NRIC 0474]